MGKGETMLTTEEITEMLMHHDELLEMYRMQINELTKEYDAENDLIEMTQLHSPQYGIVGKSSNQMISIKYIRKLKSSVRNIKKQFVPNSKEYWNYTIRCSRFICATCICHKNKKVF